MANTGFIGYAEGYIKDQTQLLQTIIDGLAVYNKTEDPLVSLLCADEIREQARVSQAPLAFDREGEGAAPDAKKVQFRLLSFPLETFNLSTPWTKTGLEDSLPSDVIATGDAAMAGHSELVKAMLIKSIFTKKTAGSIGTAYQASFYNGETDAPNYGNFTNYGSAANNYAGLNTTTFAKSQVTAAVEQLNKFGYARNLNNCIALFSTDQQSDVEAVMDNSSTVFATPMRVKAVDDGVQSGIKVAGVQCVFDPFVPVGYFSVIDYSVRPIARRLHPNPSYQGLRIEGAHIDPQDPLVGAYYRARFGFAVRHLGAGVVRQLIASNTYTNPSLRIA
jgi:hypothetical protein